jgi:hypothetical protein
MTLLFKTGLLHKINLITSVVHRHRFDADPEPDPTPSLHMLENHSFFTCTHRSASLLCFFLSRHHRLKL